jgi:phage/plasmid-associated DNA primase
MVSGEGISIARKNAKAISNREWKTPMVWAGNNFPEDYNDNAGSVSRRLVMALFLNKVDARDTQLKAKILETELPTVLLRCIFAYRAKVTEIGSRDFWKCMPKALRDAQEEVKQESNPLANFLANGSSRCQILHEEGAVTPLIDLGKAYSNYMEYDMKKLKQVIGSDFFPIKAAGFTMNRVNLCKTCGKPADAKTCGAHYSQLNRAQRMCILGMRILKQDPR